MNNNIQCSIESSTTSMELNSAADGIYLAPELEGIAGLPEIRTTSGVNAGYDGGWTSAQNYDARLIAIRGVIANKDIAKVEAMRRKLASLLGQGRKEQLTLRFTTEAGNAYTISVRTISCEMALQRVLNKQGFLIQLRADDPLIYDDGASGGTEAILRVQQALGGFEINFGLPLAIGGSSDATAVENGAETIYPIIKLYGPLHSPTLVNMTTNQQMQIIADLGYTINWSGWTGVSGERLSIPNELDKEAPLRLWSVDGNTAQDSTPTPSAPVPVQTVTGRQTVTVAGKNLIEPRMPSWTYNGVLCTNNGDGSFTLNGTATATATWRISQSSANGHDNMLNLNGTYTLSCSGLQNGMRLVVTQFNVWQTVGAMNGNENPATFTTNLNDLIVYVAVTNGTTVNNVTIRPMLEVGNRATAYEPFNGQRYEINLGKNLLKLPTTPYTAQGLTTTPNADGSFTYTGTTTGEWANMFNTYSNPIPAGTYMFSKQTGHYYTLRFDHADGTNTRISISTTQSGEITLPKDATRYQFWVWGLTPNTEYNVTERLQLERGYRATDFAPYFEPIELCKIGTYQDRIYKDGEKWYLHKEVGKVVFNGSENWSLINSGSSNFYYNLPVFVTPKDQDIMPVSDYFVGTPITNGNTSVGLWITNAGTIRARKETEQTLADFKTWLGTALPSVYYVLATPTTTEITNEEILEGLEAIGDATLYVGTNNIYTDTPSALPTLEVDYPTDYDEEHGTVVIDSQARTITLNGADIYHLKTEESEFPVLAPGENRMYLTSATTSDTGYAEVKFKQGYLSI